MTWRDVVCNGMLYIEYVRKLTKIFSLLSCSYSEHHTLFRWCTCCTVCRLFPCIALFMSVPLRPEVFMSFVSVESRESSRGTAPRTDSSMGRHTTGMLAQNTSVTLSHLTDSSSQSSVRSTGATAANVMRQSMTSSRREELLQQLKAVEDAIAKKRSKMHWLCLCGTEEFPAASSWKLAAFCVALFCSLRANMFAFTLVSVNANVKK